MGAGSCRASRARGVIVARGLANAVRTVDEEESRNKAMQSRTRFMLMLTLRMLALKLLAIMKARLGRSPPVSAVAVAYTPRKGNSERKGRGNRVGPEECEKIIWLERIRLAWGEAIVSAPRKMVLRHLATIIIC